MGVWRRRGFSDRCVCVVVDGGDSALICVFRAPCTRRAACASAHCFFFVCSSAGRSSPLCTVSILPGPQLCCKITPQGRGLDTHRGLGHKLPPLHCR